MADHAGTAPHYGPNHGCSEADRAAPLTWVIGAGGLLGSALVARLRQQGRHRFAPAEPLAWDQPKRLETQVRRALTRLGERLETGQPWEIHWAAGRASMASSAGELEADRRGFQALLDGLAEGGVLTGHPGILVLASSAGGIYAGSPAHLIDEDTLPQPNNPYGHWKLEQEALTRQLVADGYANGAFIARISTLYGISQSNANRSGLIRTIARQLLRRQPVHIFVPLDTMRDYIAVQDASAMILAGADQVWGHALAGDGRGCLTRIVASEQPTAISELLGIFHRLTRRKPLIVTSICGPGHLYKRCVRFRSNARPEYKRLLTTPLHLGIAAVLQAERQSMVGQVPR
jgi:UDP-glucose 4-epimerase